MVGEEGAKEFMAVVTPITQRHVADACGLHPSTVCLALKNSPSIPAETRRRVQIIAEELGYSPNVAARNLALLRTGRKESAKLPLAWINQEARRDHWRSDGEARLFFEAARRRAADLGYHLEEIWTHEPGMTPARIVQILRARGIEGVLFPAHHSFDFSLLSPSWSDFSIVGFNDHRLGEWVDIVCPDYYGNTDLALRHLRHLGFTNPGLAITAQFDAATNGLVRSCFLRHQFDAPETSRIPVCFSASGSAATTDTVREWCRDYRPDAILCYERSFAQAVRAAASDVVVMQLNSMPEPDALCVDTSNADVATTAVDCVVEKIRRFEKGFRDATRLHTVRGSWQEGRAPARTVEPVVA